MLHRVPRCKACNDIPPASCLAPLQNPHYGGSSPRPLCFEATIWVTGTPSPLCQGRPRSPKIVHSAEGGKGEDKRERIIVIVRSPC